jgi:hypothetical protein
MPLLLKSIHCQTLALSALYLDARIINAATFQCSQQVLSPPYGFITLCQDRTPFMPWLQVADVCLHPIFTGVSANWLQKKCISRHDQPPYGRKDHARFLALQAPLRTLKAL